MEKWHCSAHSENTSTTDKQTAHYYPIASSIENSGIIIILKNVTNELNATFGENQHGFRKKSSTTTALARILDVATEHYDDKTIRGVGILSLDLTKAFRPCGFQNTPQKTDQGWDFQRIYLMA